MAIETTPDMVGRSTEWERLADFATSGVDTATLGIVWGRRRVGKSFMLDALAAQTGGFYYQAIRGSSAEALRDLGEYLGRFQGAVAPLALPTWEAAIDALMALGRDREVLVVLDEFPYLLEHTPSLDSMLQRAYGPRAETRLNTRTRLVLCGSAISIMGKLLSGTAPIRGRASLDLRVAPFDFRAARYLHGLEDLATAVQVYAVIGGVAAYAREMSEHDLPANADDFTRWICRRVISPAAPLFGEVELLFSEDPELAKARKVNLYHATLAGVALGNHAWAKLTNYVNIRGGSLQPIVDALVAAELITRVADPVRDNRPTYRPADPLLRFHYAVIRRHQARLARHGADTDAIWQTLIPTFRSLVLGPCFEAMARYWTTHFAAEHTLGGSPDHVGSTTLTVINTESGDEESRELDVVVSMDDATEPSNRSVIALGEAKVGETITLRHVSRLEDARTALGSRAGAAKLLIFGSTFDDAVLHAAASRSELELVDLHRLYNGS